MGEFFKILLTWRKTILCSSFPLLISDTAALVCSYYATLLIRFHSSVGKQLFTWINVTFGLRENAEVGFRLEQFYVYEASRLILILAVTLVLLYSYADLYARRKYIRRRYKAGYLILCNLTALGLFYAYFYLTRNEFHPRSLFASLLAINVVITLLFRRILTRLIQYSELTSCRVLLVGSGPEADYIDRYISSRKPEGLVIVARTPYAEARPASPVDGNTISQQVKHCGSNMIICAEKSLSVSQIMQILELGEALGQEVKVLSDKLNVLINEAGIHSDFFMEFPLVHFAVAPSGKTTQRLRYLAERIMAGVLLFFAAPFLLLVGFCIRASSPGPVFFMQERVGFNRKPFRMYKFRTMHDRAEELQAQIEEFNESGEGLFKIKNDPRITWVGRILRRFSIDEFPQLINVVKGEMALVGPRPLPRRDFENYYEEWHYGRHSGLPGLTCLWQVSGRSDINFHNMCILDDYYLRNQNVLLDLKILARTVGVVVFAKGAY